MQRNEIESLREQWKAEQKLEKYMQSDTNSAGRAMEGDSIKILAQLASKMSIEYESKERPRQEILQKSVVNELEGMTCPICMEHMLPPLHCPMIVIPCGHSFCQECIEEKGKARVDKCPICRSKVNSLSRNIALQNLVRIYSESKGKSNEAVQNNQDGGNYKEKVKMLKVRIGILEKEANQCENELITQNEESYNLHSFLQTLTIEKQKVEQKLAAIQAELKLINSHISQTTSSISQSQSTASTLSKKRDLISGSLLELANELKKAEILSNSFLH